MPLRGTWNRDIFPRLASCYSKPCIMPFKYPRLFLGTFNLKSRNRPFKLHFYDEYADGCVAVRFNLFISLIRLGLCGVLVQ